MHPWKSEEYREAARMIRQIGRDCFQERMAAVKNGEDVPNDILSTILKIGSKNCIYNIHIFMYAALNIFVVIDQLMNRILQLRILLMTLLVSMALDKRPLPIFSALH